MPEIKNSFQQGKMNKDLDLRLVPNGQYRDALNIEVSTSESDSHSDSSNVGTVQNILGNSKIPIASGLVDGHKSIASISDEQTNSIYWFLAGKRRNEITAPTWNSHSQAGMSLKHANYIVEYSDVNGISLVVTDLYNVRKQYYVDNVDSSNQTFITTATANVNNLPDARTEPVRELYLRDKWGVFEGMKLSVTEDDGTVHELAVVEKVEPHNWAYNNGSGGTGGMLGQKVVLDREVYLGISPLTVANGNPNPNGKVFEDTSSHDGSSIDFMEFHNHGATGDGVLRFDNRSITTGINIMDGMIFWTDNRSEPKKINIERSKAGTLAFTNMYGIEHTELWAANTFRTLPVKLQEKHITIIRKSPTKPPTLELFSSRGINSGIHAKAYINNASTRPLESQETFRSDNIDDTTGAILNRYIRSVDTISFNFGTGNNAFSWEEGDILNFKAEPDTVVDQNSFPILDTLSPDLKAEVVYVGLTNNPSNPHGNYFNVPSNVSQSSPGCIDGNGDPAPCQRVRLKWIYVNPAAPSNPEWYAVEKDRSSDILFERKFPRFAYRYKYIDGEYSTFSPFSNIAFIPGPYRLSAEKGFNLGMQNHVKEVVIKDFVPANIPEDVVQVDILYKESDLPNIYVVDSLKPNDPIPEGQAFNYYKQPGTGDNKGVYKISSNTIFATVAESQLIRTWDSVPRKALAQEIVGNRLIYANYVRNYDMSPADGNQSFRGVFNLNIHGHQSSSWDNKSVKSLREYQVGIVFTDEYGRETPVFTEQNASLTIHKGYSATSNILEVRPKTPPPLFAHGYKFFIKETSSEYYNLVMDRWYDAGDGCVWLSFYSRDRNKVDEDTFLHLKRGNDGEPSEERVKYPVLAIENEAPEHIKVKIESLGKKPNNSSNFHSVTGVSTHKKLFFPPSTSNHNLPCTGRDTFSMQRPMIVNSAWAAFATSNIGAATASATPSDTAPGPLIHDKYSEGLVCRFLEYDKTNSTNVCHLTHLTPAGGTYDFRFYPDIPLKVSRWYKISNLIISKDAVRCDLEEKLGEDCYFVNPTGSDLQSEPGAVPDGIVLEVGNRQSHNLPEFEGRFFVKVNKDKGIDEDIQLHDPNATPDWNIFHSQATYYYNRPGDGSGTTALKAGGTHALETYKEKYQAEPVAGMKPDDKIDFDTVKNQWAAHFGDGTNYQVQPSSNSVGGPKWFIDKLLFAGSQWGRATTNDEKVNGDLNGAWGRYQWSDGRPYGYPGAQNAEDGTDNEYLWFAGPTYITAETMCISNDTWGRWKYDDRASWLSHAKGITANGVYTTEAFDTSATWNTQNGLNLPNSQNPPQNYHHGIYNLDHQNAPVGAQRGSDGDGTGIGIDGEYIDISFSGTGMHVDEYWPKTWHHGGGNLNVGAGTAADLRSLLVGETGNTAHGGAKFFNDITGGGCIYNEPDGSTNDFPMLGGISQGGTTASLLVVGNRFRFGPSAAWIAANPNNNVHEQVYTIIGIEKFHRWNFLDNYLWLKGREPRPEVNWKNSINDIGIGPIGAVTRPNDTNYAISATNQYMNGAKVLYPYDFYVRGQDCEQATHSCVFGSCSFSLTHGFYDPSDTTNINYNKPNLIGNLQDPELSMNRRLTFRVRTYPAIGSNGWYNPIVDEASGDLNHDNYVNIDFVEVSAVSQGEASETPAVWETEPKEDSPLNIYHQASEVYSIKPTISELKSLIPTNSIVTIINPDTTVSETLDPSTDVVFTGITDDGGVILVNANSNNALKILQDSVLRFTWNEGMQFIDFSCARDHQDTDIIYINRETYSFAKTLNWFNCYSFGNGVESDRIRDVFNAATIDNGPRVSSTEGWQYTEERLPSSLIFSGIYNSKTGTNNTNQFINAEKPTKDLNPTYGSIQKLHARDTDLVTLCEDKILRIVANKEALYNADGNPQLIATNKVLGQAVPYVGEYGISKNPESFASESFRSYFTDKQRGAVLRLSKDGLTPISMHGMQDWFRDNISNSSKLIGSYDGRKNNYNLTIIESPATVVHYPSTTVSFSEWVKGWTSFKDFIPEFGETVGNDYFTIKDGELWKHHHKSAPRNSFYGTIYDSSISVVLNQSPETVKGFKTLNYEGTQAKVRIVPLNDGRYDNKQDKRGWWVEEISTTGSGLRQQHGSVKEFIKKEGKWFNYIRGWLYDGDQYNNDNTDEFSFQGLGVVHGDPIILDAPPVFGCMDPQDPNYNPLANVNDGSCAYS